MLLSKLFMQYKEYQRSLGKLARTTQGNYNGRLARFLTYLGANATAADITRPKVAHYIAAISARTPLSARINVAAISSFARWLIGEGWLRKNPAEDVELPPKKTKRREPIPDDTIQKLFDACERLPVTPYKRALTRALLAVITYGGLRRCEVIGLRVEDFNPNTGKLFIREGKGGKERDAFLCSEGIDAVTAYLQLRPECTHDYLFAWSWRDRLAKGGFAAILKRVHTVAGIDRKYTSHQFRHAYASRLDRNGAELAAISAALGHTRVDVTADYIHSNQERLKAIASLASLTPSKPDTRHPTPDKTEKTAPSSRSAKQERKKRFIIERLRGIR
jgi:site-specific recombinase XerD